MAEPVNEAFFTFLRKILPMYFKSVISSLMISNIFSFSIHNMTIVSIRCQELCINKKMSLTKVFAKFHDS